MPIVDLDNTWLSDIQLQDFKALLKANRQVFANRPEELTLSYVTSHVIDTMDVVPIRQHPYKTSPTLKHEIQKLVDQLLTQGVIERAQSPWNSPALIAKKKNNQYRFLTDLRAVNRISRKYSNCLPNPVEIFETIGLAFFIYIP